MPVNCRRLDWTEIGNIELTLWIYQGTFAVPLNMKLCEAQNIRGGVRLCFRKRFFPNRVQGH